MQSHAVADAPLEGSPDEPECDDAERYDTSSDNIELPTDQKVGDSSSSERADQGFVRRKNPILLAQCWLSVYQKAGDSSSSEPAARDYVSLETVIRVAQCRLSI
jgi:hypothetical protein